MGVGLAASDQLSLVLAADQILGDGESFVDGGVFHNTLEVRVEPRPKRIPIPSARLPSSLGPLVPEP